jgi:hypothetical protein
LRLIADKWSLLPHIACFNSRKVATGNPNKTGPRVWTHPTGNGGTSKAGDAEANQQFKDYAPKKNILASGISCFLVKV